MAPGVRSLAALLVFAVSVGLAGCGGGSQTLDAEALKKQAEAIESLAAEGALLAADVSEGDTTSLFARVHAEALGKNAETVVAMLAPGEAKPAAGSRSRPASLTPRRGGARGTGEAGAITLRR